VTEDSFAKDVWLIEYVLNTSRQCVCRSL